MRLVTLGYLTNVADLLRSPGDDISPMTGIDLAKLKVDRFVLMGGRYPEHTDSRNYGNFKPDPDLAVLVAENWPGTIYFPGDGEKVPTGFNQAKHGEDNPVRVALRSLPW